MNHLEKWIWLAAIKAQKIYGEMTGGWWLMHGPESFLQQIVALEVSRKKDIRVYTECSPKRLKKDHDCICKGRPPKINDQQRFDLVFWWKQNGPRAILEAKLALTLSEVVKDAEKLLAYKKEANRLGLSSGYLLIYTEARSNVNVQRKVAGAGTINKRFDDWEGSINELTRLPFSRVQSKVWTPKNSNDANQIWSYGFVLYRIDFANKPNLLSNACDRIV